jgi:AcrR family transcriptional regulator
LFFSTGSTMRRTKEQAAVTRQTILAAAEQLFLERGYDHVSLDQIAEAAGATRGAVHFHFVNKPGLMLTLCEEDYERLLALVERLERLEPEHDPAKEAVALDELLEILVSTLTAYQGNDGRRAMIRAFIAMGLKLTNDERAAFLVVQQRLHAVLNAVFAAAAARGQLAASWTARTAATALFSMMNGLMVGWAMDSEVQLAPAGVEAVRGLIAAFRG